MDTLDTNRREVVDNNLVWSILSTLFCCLPIGIYAIILSSKVDGLVAVGRVDEAKQTAEKAKKWSIYSAIAALIGWVLYFVVFILLGALGASAR